MNLHVRLFDVYVVVSHFVMKYHTQFHLLKKRKLLSQIVTCKELTIEEVFREFRHERHLTSMSALQLPKYTQANLSSTQELTKVIWSPPKQTEH